MEVVGYKLIELETGETVTSWGGIWGQCPAIPGTIRLPNGDEVCAPHLNIEYGGLMLVPWEIEEPPPAVPQSVTPRQVRLLLLQQGLLDNVEALIAQQERAAQITWEFAIEFHRDDPLLNALAAHPSINLTTEQLDQFFTVAATL